MYYVDFSDNDPFRRSESLKSAGLKIRPKMALGREISFVLS